MTHAETRLDTTSTTRVRFDKRITISMNAEDHADLVELQRRLKTYSASDTIRHAVRNHLGQLQKAEKAKPKGR
jgi:hypothetical protein